MFIPFALGSDIGGWTYPILAKVTMSTVAIGLTGGILVLPLIFLSLKIHEKYVAITIMLWLILGLIIQEFFNLLLSSAAWSAILQSDLSNSFYGAAAKVEPLQLLRNFKEVAPTLPLHAATNMPGKTLLFSFLSYITPDLIVQGHIIAFLSNLAIVPMYQIVRRLGGTHESALQSVFLWMFLPARWVFLPILNTLTPLFLLYCILLWCTIRRSRALSLLCAMWCGVSLYALMFFEPTPLLLFIVLLVFDRRFLRTSKQQYSSNDACFFKQLSSSFTRDAPAFLCIVLGALFTNVFVWLLTNFHGLDAFLYLLRDASNFNMRANRPYLIWTFGNLIEYGFGLGIPLAILSLLVLFRLLREKRFCDMSVFLYTGCLSLLIIDVLGIQRGEVTRLWIFLSVLPVMTVPFFLRGMMHHRWYYVLLFGQFFQSILMIATIGYVVP